MLESVTMRICSVDEVEDDEPLGLELENGLKIAVYRVDGEYFVTSDVCSHGNALLSEGWQDEDKIECPFHGGSFFIKTGEPANYPCVKPVKSYPVTIEGGEILITLSDADNDDVAGSDS